VTYKDVGSDWILDSFAPFITTTNYNHFTSLELALVLELEFFWDQL
jgi:hypothetical protein